MDWWHFTGIQLKISHQSFGFIDIRYVINLQIGTVGVEPYLSQQKQRSSSSISYAAPTHLVFTQLETIHPSALLQKSALSSTLLESRRFSARTLITNTQEISLLLKLLNSSRKKSPLRVHRQSSSGSVYFDQHMGFMMQSSWSRRCFRSLLFWELVGWQQETKQPLILLLYIYHVLELYSVFGRTSPELNICSE